MDWPLLRKNIDFILFILFLQFLVYAVTLFDVPVARQVIVFSYIMTIPGFLLIRLLKIDGLDKLEAVVFSIGFSVAFVMLLGLCVNEIGLFLGFSSPLSSFPLVVTLNLAVLAEALLLSHMKRQNDVTFLNMKHIRLPYGIILSMCALVLAIAGAFCVSIFGNNYFLLAMFALIVVIVVIGVLNEKFLPTKFYPLAILLIAISLLFHSSLISGYVVSFGSDVNQEIAVFKTVEENLHWNVGALFLGLSNLQRMNGMLSVTMLPAVFTALLNMDIVWIFKLLTPFVFSFVPLILYQVWQKHVGSKFAFLSAFLFMAQSTFFTEMLGLNRQMIAEIFFSLLLLVILSREMKNTSKIVVYLILGAALVVSHYGLAEIFFFFISVTLISSLVLKWAHKRITLTMVLFFGVAMFSWYVYTSNSGVFNSFISYGQYVSNQLGDFLSPASRGQTVLMGLGLEGSPSLWNTISRAFAYITEALIIIGFLGLVAKREFFKINKEYLVFSVVATALLAALIIVPGLSDTMNMTRFYHILLFFLAPLCLMGAYIVAKPLFKFWRHNEVILVSILSLAILVPYFLFQTGFVYEITQSESWSLPLSMNRMDAYRLQDSIGYVYPQDVSSANWMYKNVEIQNQLVLCDMSSLRNVLMDYSMIFRGSVEILSNVTALPPQIVFLSRLNVRDGFVDGGSSLWNTSDISFIYGGMNKIYSNGDSEIYGR